MEINYKVRFYLTLAIPLIICIAILVAVAFSPPDETFRAWRLR